jgi:hypothetical protein
VQTHTAVSAGARNVLLWRRGEAACKGGLEHPTVTVADRGCGSAAGLVEMEGWGLWLMDEAPMAGNSVSRK